MSLNRKLLFSLVALAGMSVMSARSEAFVDDATILIDRALNSPVLTIRYSGATAATVELLVNGKSFGKRSVSSTADKGETNFTLDLSALNDGDNQIEVRLIDKNGKVVGTEKSIVTTDEKARGPVYLAAPKMGATVAGPVEIRVGFGREMKNIYVSFFIDNQFKMMSNFAPYSYLWDTTREANGWHDLEAWVVDDSSDTLKTRKLKVFVNNPGGNTTRRRTDPPTNPATEPRPVPTTPKPLELRTTSNNLNAGTGGAAAIKPAAVRPTSIAPAVSKPTSPASSLILQPLFNMLVPTPRGAGDVKAAAIGAGLTAGPKYLTPSGARLATQPAKPTTAPVPGSAATEKPMATLPAAQPSDDGRPAERIPGAPSPAKRPEPAAPAAEVLPATIVGVPNTEPAAPYKPLANTGATVAENPVKGAVPPSAPKPTVPAPKAPALIPVTIGTKLQFSGVYSIILNSKPLIFDDVQPRAVDGVPLTPFRHLFEQAGGEVLWAHADKSIDAKAESNEVYLKIGDRLAKVNALPVELDVAPFIERGRAIVPLSFLNRALNVSIDFDPKTGHVLIRRKTADK